MEEKPYKKQSKCMRNPNWAGFGAQQPQNKPPLLSWASPQHRAQSQGLNVLNGHVVDILWTLCSGICVLHQRMGSQVVVIHLCYQHGFQHKPILATVSKIHTIPDKTSTECLMELLTWGKKKKSHPKLSSNYLVSWNKGSGSKLGESFWKLSNC